MKNLIFTALLLLFLAVPAQATELTAPTVPQSGMDIMPEQTENFGTALLQLLQKGIARLKPDFSASSRICIQILVAALVCSLVALLPNSSGKLACAGASVIISLLIFQNSDSLIRLASATVEEICDYGKLLCLVMTSALAAQGAVGTSSALYAGTCVFTALLGNWISRYFIPMIYVFLILCAANSIMGEDNLRKLADSIKNILSWLLKTLLIVFTTYMSVTGVVAGTTDAVALKAAKITISTAVPVVGGILSDASEAVLVSMGLMKNAAGIYGILAVLAVFTGPFLKVGVQYLGLKLTGALCSIFASKNVSNLVNDLATAMGLLLGMLASACTLILVSTVCFLRGAS